MSIEKYYELKVSIHDSYWIDVPGFFWQKLHLTTCDYKACLPNVRRLLRTPVTIPIPLDFEAVGMTVRASKVLGWRKTERRGVQSDCGKGKVLNVYSRFVCAHSLSHGE